MGEVPGGSLEPLPHWPVNVPAVVAGVVLVAVAVGVVVFEVLGILLDWRWAAAVVLLLSGLVVVVSAAASALRQALADPLPPPPGSPDAG